MFTLLVTGLTGSLGSSILKHQDLLKHNGISKIRGISRDEQKQVSMMRNYKGDIHLDCYLGDVSDKERMMFALRDVHYVVHAAAQKHIDKFELDVKTGYKNNILGTQYVSEGFLESKNAISGLFVSTDKAALPITSYGVSKLAAEHAWLWNNSYQKNIKFGCTRSGNIFGSKGSVIETWTELAKQQKPLPITDQACTRFFMMIDDMSEFILNTLFENQRKVHIPPTKGCPIIKLAKIIWDHWNPETPFQFDIVGMRSIEKIHEVLTSDGVSSFTSEQFTEEELKEMYERWTENL